ncbi:MAG: hypothetical protein Q8Q92_03230 [bacterium]|nr:hypothetical protein [bacterium]
MQTEHQPHDSNRTIEEEIRRLGIQKNPAESALWKAKSFEPTVVWKDLSEAEALQGASRRVKTTIKIMQESHNMHFRNAADILIPLLNAQLLHLALSQAPSEKTQYSAAGIRPNIDGDSLYWTMKFPVDEVLRKPHSIELALDITHVAGLLQRCMNIDVGQTQKSPQERYTVLAQLTQDIHSLIEEESRAYAVQAQAYIVQAGLLGFHHNGSEDAEMTAMFIKTGKDPLGKAWKEFIINQRLGSAIAARRLR